MASELHPEEPDDVGSARAGIERCRLEPDAHQRMPEGKTAGEEEVMILKRGLLALLPSIGVASAAWAKRRGMEPFAAS